MKIQRWTQSRLWRLALLIGGLCLLSTSAFGQVTTYVCTGQTLTAGVVSQVNGPKQITGSITVAAPLAPNQVNQVVVPLSYGFNGDTVLGSTWVNPG